MSELDYVDALTNRELRAECIKYGLPNVPVTDSSRRVLIRRLRTVIDDGPISTKATNRRETLPKHQTRSVEAANNRRSAADSTAAAAPDANAFSGRTRIIPLTVETRRGIASQSGAFDTPPRSRSVSLSKSDVVTTSYRQECEAALPEAMEVEEQDDLPNWADNAARYDRYNYLNAPQREPQAAARSPQAPRSRSVSLSNSGVVTTSYVQEIVPLASKAPAAVYAEEEETVDNFMDYAPKVPRHKQSPAPRASILNSTRYGLDASLQNRSYSTAAASPSSTFRSNNSAADSYVSYEEQQSAEEAEEEAEEEDNNQPGDQQSSEDELLNKSIYKSKFTRQLEQQPNLEPKPVRRRATHLTNNESSVEDMMCQFLVAIDREYSLKKWAALVGGLLLAVLLYVFFIEK